MMRYGHQQYSEILSIPMADLLVLAEKIAGIVEAENKSGPRTPSED